MEVPNTQFELNSLNEQELALIMAKLCKLSYRTDVRNKAKELGFFNSVLFRHLNCECLVFENEFDVVCAFRGTDDFKDVLSAFEFATVNESELGLIHRGFKKECDKIYVDIFMYITRDPVKNVWMTGHSLGGALALLCSARLISDNKEILFKKCVTFGAPRVGYKCFVTKFADLRHDRWVIRTDPIPTMPQITGYKHHGSLYCVNSKKCAWTFSKRHSINAYINCIK